MEITFNDNKLAKIINDERKLKRTYGPENARLITRRLDQIKAASTFAEVIQMRIGRCHSLEGNLDGLYALDLDHPDRLIIKPVIARDADKSRVDFSVVKEVIIMEVRDYHGKRN